MIQTKRLSLTQILSKLCTSVAVGVYLTIILSVLVFQYYRMQEGITDKNIFLNALKKLDHWSDDQRFHLRGPRLGSPNVAVLAVDDRSIKIMGRWPWPRDIMAQAMSNAYKNGAKVIATDIVWSEPSNKKNDKIFSEFVNKNKKKLVLGHFFENITPLKQSGFGFKTACHDLIIKNSLLHKIITLQAVRPIVNDNSILDLPEVFSQNYLELVLDEEINLKAELTKSKSKFENHDIDLQIFNMKEDLCEYAFLNPDNENDIISERARNNWQAIKESDAGIAFNSFETFDEWLKNFKQSALMNTVPEALTGTFNLPDFTFKSENFGFFNAFLDNDGAIRRSHLLLRAGSAYLPSIALQSYLVSTGQQVKINLAPNIKNSLLKEIKKLTVVDSVGQNKFDIPVTPEGKLVINYAGPNQTIAHASIVDLLDEKNPNILISQQSYDDKSEWHVNIKSLPKTTFFKDKILILGATATGIYDLRVTPFDKNFPGVETHANVLDNLVRQDFMLRPRSEAYLMPLFTLALGVLLSLILAHFGAISSVLFSVFVISIILFIDKTFFFNRGFLVSTILPIIQVIFTYVFLNFYKYFTEEKSKKELRATFSKYVSPAIVEEILKDSKNLELGGRKGRVTVFFSDIRNFTTISEKLDPKILSDFLNSYLTPMTDLIFKNQGTLDKYMGDAIMAFFGAPVHYKDHAKMACRCALQNIEKLKALQIEYRRKGLPQVDIGIGLNTGECYVGNMGSKTVRNYTVMGDTVNLASRLEGINKIYGTRIMISEFTYNDVKDNFLCREVDWVRVKGKLEPVRIFELLSEGSGTPLELELVKNFSDGYSFYRKMQFEKSISLFNKALKQCPEDEVSKIYIERCSEYITTPPPSDWDGIYVMKTK